MVDEPTVATGLSSDDALGVPSEQEPNDLRHLRTIIIGIAVASAAVACVPETYPIPPVWECVHRHEQPDWHATGRYPGGLGILDAAWRENGGLQFAAHGNLATPFQQVLVGERIVARYGWRAWAARTRAACGLSR